MLKLLSCLIALSVFANTNHVKMEDRPEVKPPGPMPTVVFLSYGRLGLPGSVIGKGDPVLQAQLFEDSITACGITPKYLDDLDPANLSKLLKDEKLPEGTHVLVNSHGNRILTTDDKGKRQQKYIIGSTHGPHGSMIDGSKLVDDIASAVPNAKIWLGTCRAGACRSDYQCVGAECRYNEVAAGEIHVWQKIAKLMCDGYNGSCDLWKKVDQDRNGDITSAELANHFCMEPKELQYVEFLEGFVPPLNVETDENWDKDNDQVSLEPWFKEKCADAKGTVGRGPAQYVWAVQYTPTENGKPVPTKSEFEITDPIQLAAYRKLSAEELKAATKPVRSMVAGNSFTLRFEGTGEKMRVFSVDIHEGPLQESLPAAVALESNKTKVLVEVRKRYPKFPENCGENRTKCGLVPVSKMFRYTCTYHSDKFCRGLKVPGTEYRPDVKGFHLKADRCKG